MGLLAAGALLSCAAPLACAQATVGVSARIAPPVHEGMPSIKLPHAKSVTLDNGLRVLIVERYGDLPTFTAQMVFTEAGGLYEPPHRRGLAKFTADLLREGTADKDSLEIARQLETLGVTLDSDAPPESANATVTVSGLSTHFDQVMALLAEVVRHPAFKASEVTRYASHMVAELEQKRARPEFLAQEQLRHAIYGDHPAGLLTPPVRSIKAMRDVDLQRFYTERYRPNRAVLVLLVPLSFEQALTTVKHDFGTWEKQEGALAPLEPLANTQPPGVYLVDRPGSVQTVLQMGVLSIKRTDADFIAAQVMNEIEGGQSTARLFLNLREKHGYTYGAYSGLDAGPIPGMWQANTSVRTDVTEPALKEMLSELRRMQQQPVTAIELENAKRALIGRYIFSLERPERTLDNIVTQVIYQLPDNYWDTYIDQVNAVTLADVTRAAQRIVMPDQLQIVAVGDGAKVRSILAQYGKVRDPASLAATEKGFSAAERAQFRASVAQIADKLIADAAVKPAGIGWINTNEEGKAEETYNFYNGNAGIAYFLLKAYQTTGDAQHLAAAKAAMSHLESQAKTDAQGRYFDAEINGVFEGNAGPGYSFLYAWHVTGDKHYLQLAESLAQRMVALPDVKDKSSPDIISGAAGAGLFLLEMHQATGKKIYLDGARQLGDFLLAHADPRGAGLTWKLIGPKQEYYFVGFSHGPAGIGYYLDQLYTASGDARYKTASEKAMTHIENIALHEQGYVKWYHEELKRQTRYSSQWCHGAPGMSPYFLERATISDDPKYRLWANQSTEYALERGVNIRGNAFVCHGISGNAASLYQMYQATHNEDYFTNVRAGVDMLYNTKDAGKGWWSEGGTDYSYMTGLAGVGDFFALLASDGKLNMFGPLGYGDDLPGNAVSHSGKAPRKGKVRRRK